MSVLLADKRRFFAAFGALGGIASGMLSVGVRPIEDGFSSWVHATALDGAFIVALLPADWKPAKRRQKDIDATWTKKHGKSCFVYQLSINVDKKDKIIRKIETDTASTHDSQHFDNVFDAEKHEPRCLC